MNYHFANHACSFRSFDQPVVHAIFLCLGAADLTRFGLCGSTLGRLGLHIAQEINLRLLCAVHCRDLGGMQAALLKGAHPNCWSLQYAEGTAFITVARMILHIQVPRTRSTSLLGSDQVAGFSALALLIDYGLSSFCGAVLQSNSIHSVVASVLSYRSAVNYATRTRFELRRYTWAAVVVNYRNVMGILVGHAMSRGGKFLANFCNDCLDEADFHFAMSKCGLPDEVITEVHLQSFLHVIRTSRQHVLSERRI